MRAGMYVAVFLISIYACRTGSISVLKDNAHAAIQNKQYSDALRYLDQAIQMQPDDQEAHYFRGQALRSMLFDDGAYINRVDLPLAEKASAAFERVIEINPKYDGRKFVVDPYTKIQSVWGSMATTFTVKGKLDSARWAMKRGKVAGAYYPAILEYNKNTMASCAENTIIFTNGDNDTYPMWYLQLIDGYRTDITVVNLSLLNVEWYIRQLRENYPYGENNLECVKDTDIDRLQVMPWQETVVNLPKHPDFEEQVSWTLKPTVEDKLIRRQDLMVVEILKNNSWKRPVYFSTTVYKGNKIGLDDYLALEGLVFRVVPEKKVLSPERLQKNLIGNYTYQGFHDSHFTYIEELKPLYRNYTAAFQQLFKFYSDAGRSGDAQKVLEFMQKNLPADMAEI